MARVFQVDSVSISIQKTNPPTLLVVAAGRVGTPGWKHLDLVSMEATLSADGILDLEFVGDPPTGIVPMVITAVTADYMTTVDVDRIVGVLVHARTNTMPAFVSIGPEADFSAMPSNRWGNVTTQAVGEENGKTWNAGEEGKTWNGEEGKTWYVGEESQTWNVGESMPGTGESNIIKMGEKNEFGEHNEGTISADVRYATRFNSPFGRR